MLKLARLGLHAPHPLSASLRRCRDAAASRNLSSSLYMGGSMAWSIKRPTEGSCGVDQANRTQRDRARESLSTSTSSSYTSQRHAAHCAQLKTHPEHEKVA